MFVSSSGEVMNSSQLWTNRIKLCLKYIVDAPGWMVYEPVVIL